jgi:hypothetical protein
MINAVLTTFKNQKLFQLPFLLGDKYFSHKMKVSPLFIHVNRDNSVYINKQTVRINSCYQLIAFTEKQFYALML